MLKMHFICNQSTGHIEEIHRSVDPPVVLEGCVLYTSGVAPLLTKGSSFNPDKWVMSRHSHKIIDYKLEFIEGWESEEEIVGDPFNMLRGQRNGRLSATDWRASSDLTLTTEWADYRQELRDLPANSTPVNENGILTGVDWPEEPE